MALRYNSHPVAADLPPLAVLGLRGRGRAEWSRLRALQYAQLAQVTRTQVITQAIAALAAVWLFQSVVSHMLLAGWLLVLAISLLGCVRTGQVFLPGARRTPRRRRILRHIAATGANALVWAAPMLRFAQPGMSQARIELWTILAMLMTVSAVVIPAVPLATAIFAVIVGVTAMAVFALAHTFVMADIVALFTVIIIGGAIEASRNFLITRLAEAGVAERNEVVSLLLREYEEGEANWLWDTDERLRVLAPSRRFVDALGLTFDQVDGRGLIALLGGGLSVHSHPDSLGELADKLAARDSFSGLAVQVSIRGEPRWWEVAGCPRYDADGCFMGFRGVAADVTAQREQSDRMAWLARYDTLTGLPNRMALTEALREAMGQARLRQGHCAFLMIDLDRFKAVNDSLGHLIGDQLLASVAERLTSLIDKRDTCGRLGGDEFAIVIADAADAGAVTRLGAGVIARLSEPYEVEGHQLSVGVSIGSAVSPADGESIEVLMRHADLALYRAKDEGGAAHCLYVPGMSHRVEERMRLETALRGALARDEISLHFQPIVATVGGRVLAFEAMARWQSPEDGLIGPGRFIPMAEETRMSAPIGEWVLRAACREAMAWPEDIALAVNVSAEQLLDAGFPDSVVWALATSGLAPQRLAIEVTEAIFARDAVSARAVLDRLVALGCSVTLDDFGIGQSALCHLRATHFSTIKVDGSFVRGAAEGNPESLAILRAAVAVASSLEMAVVAEGVESEAELQLARDLACSGVQGFLLGAPMTGEEVLALVRVPPVGGKVIGRAG
jgi:diguanylate cyclase (GGDEF)-like protein